MHEREAIDQEDKAQQEAEAETTATTTETSVEPYAPAGKSTTMQLDNRQLGVVMRALEREGLTPASSNGWREYKSIHYYNSRLKLGHYGLFRIPIQVILGVIYLWCTHITLAFGRVRIKLNC
jgi:hypothetical protein